MEEEIIPMNKINDTILKNSQNIGDVTLDSIKEYLNGTVVTIVVKTTELSTEKRALVGGKITTTIHEVEKVHEKITKDDVVRFFADGKPQVQFACGLSQLTKGSNLDKIKWIFSLYDIDGDGYISRSELKEVIQAIYDLLGNKLLTGNIVQAIEDRVNTMFTKYDLDHDGKISKDEFFSVSTQVSF
ncbi:neurocalcin, putative [Schistosoma mansoni]|uniref:neurocalcin, putative n=1 Tax=Schistosoma mansoni TaxID=6183 RepID=UPI0001A61741|nr:neurocalcin, putative [Schistosoma mansoni]|eukprot:XP_018645383.1 neurocalcin, putative [Schistosoma mansoni]